MIQKYRKEFNRRFSDEKYAEVYQKVKQKCGKEAEFRISESPIFLTSDFRKKLIDVSESIIDQILQIPDQELKKAIPENHLMADSSTKPHFLAIDFGICRDGNGELSPQLIELQGFPSLFGYKKFFEEVLVEIYPFLDELKNPISNQEYASLLKSVILADENPENTILLEIFPEKQKTNIDFRATEKMIGIPTICLTKVKRKGRRLFYEKKGNLIPIHRIYNRVIFDELDRFPDLKLEFDFKQDVDVEWVTHPNWFFKISKYLLPRLKHRFIPKSYYLNRFPKDENPKDYVLKPLFSFAGSGVELHPTWEKLQSIPDPENFILQKKVNYEAVFEDLNGDFSKAELRMLFVWDPKWDRPRWINNLVRMTKSEMINVDFNKKGSIWIGSSIAFFERG